MKRYLQLALLLCSNTIVLAAAISTTGTNSTWSSAAAWNLGRTPTGADSPINVNHNITSASSLSLGNYQNGNTLIIAAGRTMTINGNLSMSSSGTFNLVISAGATLIVNGNIDVSQRNIIQNNGTLISTGNITLSNFSGNAIDNSGTITSSGTLTVTGSSAMQSTSGTMNIGNLVVSGNASALIANTDLNASGNVTVANSGVLTLTGGTADIDGNVDISGSTRLTIGTPMKVAGAMRSSGSSVFSGASGGSVAYGSWTASGTSRLSCPAGTGYTAPSVPSVNPIDMGNCNVSLPVTFVSFTGHCSNDGKVHLEWKTAKEIGVSHYLVERSRDGKNFETTGKVVSNKEVRGSVYSYADLATSMPYYRVKVVDEDGTVDYSSVIYSNPISGNENVHLNNPLAIGGNLVIQGLETDETVDVIIYDLKGKPVFEQDDVRGETTAITLPAGMYEVLLSNISMKHVEKLVVY